MARSSKKGPYIDPRLLAKINKRKAGGDRSSIRTWARASEISPDFVGVTFAVHNGRVFTEVFVTESMVGHRLGEFAPTRTFRGHGQVTKRVLDKT